MNEFNRANEQPRHPSAEQYQTGRTRPPKNHGGVIAALLVLVIFLCGIISILGLMNIRLFRQISIAKTRERSLLAQCSPSQAGTETESDPARSFSDGDIELNINSFPVSADIIPQGGTLSLQEIYSRSIDSVVSITCTLDDGSSSGTGVVLTEDGYILTNSHVIEDAKRIRVRFKDKQEYTASLLGEDELSDLAVLWVDAQGLSPAQFGDSSVLQVGDSVVAIGDPLGSELAGTMTDGIVSAINREISIGGRTMTLIQTNAALNSGNSGGPLINCYGQIIGINTMKVGTYMAQVGVEGLGFAIPSTTVKEVVDQILSQGYVSGRPTLGITGQEISGFYHHYYNIPLGICITEVEPDSDSYAQGLRSGDILLSFNGTRVKDEDTLKSLLYAASPGDTAKLIIYRSGHQYEMTVTIEETE